MKTTVIALVGGLLSVFVGFLLVSVFAITVTLQDNVRILMGSLIDHQRHKRGDSPSRMILIGSQCRRAPLSNTSSLSAWGSMGPPLESGRLPSKSRVVPGSKALW